LFVNILRSFSSNLDPFSKGQVQQRVTKLIPAIRNRSYENSLAYKVRVLKTLKDRRGNLIQMLKIMNKIEKCDSYNRFQIIINQVQSFITEFE